MSGRRQSSQATDDREMILECKAAYLSVFDDIKDEIDSKEKLVQVLQQAGRNPTSRTISKYWKKSTDNLSFDDFVEICRKEPPTSVDDLMKAFRKIDLNGDGFLSVEELMKVLTTKGEKMSRSEVEKIISEVDEDGNGKLDYGEFCNMVMSTTEECKRKSLKMMERKERKKKKADKEAITAFQSPQTSLNAEPTAESTTKMGSTASVRSQMNEPKHSTTKMGSTTSLRSQMAEPKHSPSKIGSTASLRSQNAADETQSTTKMGSTASVRSQMAEPKHSPSKIGSTASLRSQNAADETQSKSEDSVKESVAKKSDEEAESKTEFQTRHKFNESFTKYDMEKETKTEEQENKLEAEEEIAEENYGSRVSLKMEKSPWPVPRKESVSKAVSVGEMGSKTLQTNSLKSAENMTDSQTSLRSAGQMGSRRSLISIDDLPKPSPRARKDKPKAGPSVKSTRLSEPQNLKEWTHVTSKGAFFFEEEEIVTHLYSLEIPEDTNVYITIQPTEIPGGGGIKPKNTVDTMLYLLRSRPDENGKYLITFTEQRDSNGKYVLRSDLSAGKYQLIPFTTGCRFKQRASQPKKEAKIIENGKDDTIVITKAFRKALEDIFHICDLDGNGYLSRDEFNWFNMRTSGEEIADDEWQVVEERVELKDGEITLNGFVQLNEMEAEDSEGDTDDLWMTLSSMGFNKALIIDELCTYRIDVYTEDCDDAEFKVTGIESLAEKVEAEICQSVIDKGKATPVKGMKDLVMYTYTSGTRAAIVLDNKSRSTVKMKVDCSKSKNCVSHRGDLEYIMDLSSHSTMVAHHILPEDDSSEWVLHCTETVLK